MKARYLWLDLETTGLEPDDNLILECAAFASDERLEPVGGEMCMILYCPEPMGNDFVRDIHARTGLWDDCKRSTKTIVDLESALLTMIACFDWQDEQPILAGATINFDRGFLREHCPDVASKLHYRLFDVRPITLLAEEAAGVNFRKSEAHRAWPDVQESIAQARVVRHLIRGAVRG